MGMGRNQKWCLLEMTQNLGIGVFNVGFEFWMYQSKLGDGLGFFQSQNMEFMYFRTIWCFSYSSASPNK